MGNVKVMISLPEPVLEAVDRAARDEHRSRSEFFREAVRLYLQVRAARQRPIDDPEVRQAVALMDQLAQDDRVVRGWDTVTAVRRDRDRDRGG